MACIVAVSVLGVARASAQDVSEEPLDEPPPPLQVWKGSVAAGLALTSGNTDTSTLNAAYEVVRDAKERLVFKSTGLFIRGEKEGARTVDRTSADARLDYRLTERLTAFGQLSYLRDHFKRLKFSFAPTLGFGYAIIDTEQSQLLVDSSLGAVFERHQGMDVPERRATTSAAYALGQRLTRQVTDRARCTQSFTALWKIDDFGDALYTASAGIAASISDRSELKAEVLNTISTEPAAPELEKGDVSVLMSVVYKF